MADKMLLTYQTRPELSDEQEVILRQYARLMSVVEHSLFAEVAKGKTTESCKNHFLEKFKITARQFNACRVSLEGKIEACRSGQERAVDSLSQHIESLDQQIYLLERKPSKQFILHQKKRRRAVLQQRLALVK